MAFAWAKQPVVEPDVDPLVWQFKSPGLELLADRLESPGIHEVLDLGAAREANLVFFSQFRCHLHIEDVYPELVNFPREDPLAESGTLSTARAAMLERVLVCQKSTGLDLILGWDLFNYLEPEAIKGLMGQVSTRCRPGTMLFLLMSTGESLPGEPARITLNGGNRICYEPACRDEVKCPRYAPLILERMMPGFHLLHSFLLGEQMQDYLFIYR